MYAIRGSYPRGYDGYSHTVFAVSSSIEELEISGKDAVDKALGKDGRDGPYCGLDIVELPSGVFDLEDCVSVKTLASNWI